MLFTPNQATVDKPAWQRVFRPGTSLSACLSVRTVRGQRPYPVPTSRRCAASPLATLPRRVCSFGSAGHGVCARLSRLSARGIMRVFLIR
jgi:hypothetical protein